MYILTKYKDYYDYLSGIYGVDPLLILDRREGYITSFPYDKGKIILYICGYRIEGYYDGIRYWFGEDLKQFENETKYKSSRGPQYPNVVIAEYTWDNRRIYAHQYNDHYALQPEIDNKNYNLIKDCPILELTSISGYNIPNFSKFPRLSDLNLASFIPAEEIYQWLSTWLAQRVDKSQERPDNLSNNQKIESKGFNLITSFRPNIK